MPYAQQQQKSVLQGPAVPDGVLIGQALAGDQSAFEGLLKRYQHPLACYIGSILKDREQVSDVLQSVFLQLYASLPTLSVRVPLQGWLFRVARNRCIDELRTSKRRAEIPFSTLEWESGEQELSAGEAIPSPEPSLEEIAEKMDLHDALQQALCLLPPKQRSIVCLRCFRQLTFPEIGRMLSMPENTVKTYFYRSLLLLRRALVSNTHVLSIW